MRDPRQRKAGGRTPYKQPYTDPGTILSVSGKGNTCTVRKPDGTVVENVHFEDVLLVPENARNIEKEPLTFDPEIF